MTTRWTCHMILKPRIDTFLMESMNTMTENAYRLPIFHRILANGTIFNGVWIQSSENGGVSDLLFGGSDDDGFHDGWIGYNIKQG